MAIEHFDDLLRAAGRQPEPQRLLFVFAGAVLPAEASEAQRRDFDAGEGGELLPLMCVDKAAAEVTDFRALCAEAARAGPPWTLVFSAALSGRGGRPPATGETDAALRGMVDSIRAGRLDALLAFDRAGLPLRLR